MYFRNSTRICVIFLYVLFVYFARIKALDEGAECNIPNGQNGLCTPIPKCQFVLNLLKPKLLSKETVTFLQALKCGNVGSTVLVCCPSSNVRSPTNPDEPIGPEPNIDSSGEKPSGLLAPPECGLSPLSTPKIVGGINAHLGDFPWMVALGFKNTRNPQQPRWLCGGTLITKNHVLTAAHCVRDDLYLARVGEINLYKDDDGAHPVDIPIAKRIVHEGYAQNRYLFDIAILVLSRNIDGIENTGPICLPWESDLRTMSYLNHHLYITGWGSTIHRGPTTDVLQVTNVPIIENSRCKEQYTGLSDINDTVLCAGVGKKDACGGDSGGPLMYGKKTDDNEIGFYLVGVISYGSGCANPNYAGVYARVTFFIDWIREHII
ncbi:venom protease-like [Sitophilus oryzae]|uniref:CLIP domain-containing serine protease n=1 Tax=Sitophilus oryzae TaxID=7048 RepID=A0A6J2XZA8_SITOR|nr:venom protease-like [Sitophilus oryzae]